MKSDITPLLAGQKPPPLLLVVSGPSGVGKDSVLLRMRELGLPFHFVVTMNSRPQRPGEIDGVDYHFVKPERFEEMIAQGELLEWARVYNQYKGVPRFEVRQALASGRDVVMRVDVTGAQTIRQLAPDAVLVFLAPGSMDELHHRLRMRRTESPDEIETRLRQATAEFEQVPLFDYVVLNHEGQLDQTVSSIRAILTAEKQRVFPRRIEL